MKPTLHTIVRAPLRPAASCESGQALLEFLFVVLLLISLLFALIDFGRVLYVRQLLINVTREGASLASRETDFTNTAAAVTSSAEPLKLLADGRVIVSLIINSNGMPSVSNQFVTASGVLVSSRIGQVGAQANLPHNPVFVIPQPYQTLYAVEVFYHFEPVTPVGQLLRFTLPSQLYDVAYF